MTRQLNEMANGRQHAGTELISLICRELHDISRHLMHGEELHHTLQPTALVHEAYLRLVRLNGRDWHNRTHFLRVAARVMRRIVVDHAPARQAQKPGAINETLFEPLASSIDPDDADRILAVDEALTRLSLLDQRQARIVEPRFHAGMTVEETAEALQLPLRTVKCEWQLARAWLCGELALR